MKQIKLFSIVTITFFTSSILFAPAATAAYTVIPKVGQCFQYTSAQVSAKYAPKNPINCSSSHNMETFAVVTWPLKTNPVDMDREETLNLVD
jgi:hypothetical protein